MTVVSGVLAGLLALVALTAALATRVAALERPVRTAVVAAEAAVVLFVVADLGLVLRADGDRPDSLVTHFGYAVAAAGLIPALAWRVPAPGEAPSPGEVGEDVEPASLWVVVVALLAVAGCVVRLAQTR